jgi:hypothetical protein
METQKINILNLPLRSEAWKKANSAVSFQTQFDEKIRFLATTIGAVDRAFVNAESLYFFPELDREIELFARDYSHDRPQSGTRESTSEDRPLMLHFASALYDSGGHTAVIVDYVREFSNFRHLLIVDDIPHALGFHAAPSSVLAKTRIAQLKELGCEVRLLSGSLQNRLGELISAHIQAEILILHHHPWDALPVIAAHTFSKRVVLELHSDNAMTLGLSSGWDIVCYRAVTIEFLRKQLPDSRFFLVPLTSFYEGRASAESVPDEEPFFTVSAVLNPNKVSPFGESDYFSVIARMTEKLGSVHYHIGYESESFRQSVEETEAKYPGFKQRFIIQSPSPDLSKMVFARASLYIDSFPVGGGKAIVDALALSRPVVAFPNSFNDLMNNREFSSALGLEFKNADAFIAWVERFKGDEKMRASHHEAGLRYYRDHHSKKAFLKGMQSLLSERQAEVTCGFSPVMDAELSVAYAKTALSQVTATQEVFIRRVAKWLYKKTRWIPGLDGIALRFRGFLKL